MHCPLCLDAPLEPKYVNGTEVDICARCRGIWLDRGELDRLLGDDTPPPDRARQDERRPAVSERDRSMERDRYDDRGYKKPKSRSKRLADLFEDVLDL